MTGISIEDLLIAAAARQGLQLGYIEAQTIISTLQKDGYSVIVSSNWNLFYRYDGKDVESDIRELIEIADEANSEMVIEKSSDGADDEMLALLKDEYILKSVMSRVDKSIPPKTKIYKVGIVGTYKIYTNIEAASWSEAECIAKQNFADGKYEFDDTDFRGIMITSG